MQQRRPQRDAGQPFDQRFLLFAIASLALLTTYRAFFAPPPVAPPPAAQAEADALEEATDSEAAEVDGAPPADFDAIAADDAAPIEESPAAEPQRVAIGSLADDGPYRMLMTIDNVGAGVERVELGSDNYRDLDERTGYLGRLALADADGGGALVRVVGAGSPAAGAGLSPGDVVTFAALEASLSAAAPSVDQPIENAADLRGLLSRSKPRQSITLSGRRGDGKFRVETSLERPPLSLIRPEVENIRLHTPDFDASTADPAPSFVVRLKSVGGAPSLADANRRLAYEPWTVEGQADDEQAKGGVTLRMRLADLGLDVVKRFEVAEIPEGERDNAANPSYHFTLSVAVENLTDQPRDVAYELTGPNGLPIEGFWYANKIGRGDGSFFGDWGSFGLRDVVVRYAGGRLLQLAATEVAKDKVPPMGQGAPLAFAGVDSQYFASIVIPEKESLGEVKFEELRTVLATAELDERSPDRWENASFVMTRQTVTLAAAGGDDAKLEDRYTVFAGPKLPELLDAYAASDDPGHSLEHVMYYGWFGWAARPMLWLLHTFYGIVGNYGLAIILLTVVVRGAMFPISRQQALNMVKMQELKPEIDRITERYKDDMQKRSQAQQELFRKHNYNPAAGCLPLFLQLPIFMGLYRALAVDVELRQAPLISDAVRFCSNLASPDMFLDWSWLMPQWFENGQGMFALGPYFNVLPLATCGLFLLQQKLFMPEATTEQARLQQKLMQYMMLFMGLLFFKVPSGLCIYFIASSLWGIAERKMLPKPAPVAAATTEKVTPAPSKPTSSGGAVAQAKRKSAKNKAKGKKKR